MIETHGAYSYDPESGRFSGNVKRIFTFGEAHPSAIQLVPLLIHPSATMAEIKSALDTHSGLKGQRGKNGPVDTLKALGALRLMAAAGSVAKAMKHSQKNKTAGGFAPLYQHESQWSRAKSAAKDNVADVFHRFL